MIYPREIWVDTDLVGDSDPHPGWKHYVRNDDAAIQLLVLTECMCNIDRANDNIKHANWTGAAALLEVAASKLRSLPQADEVQS